MTFPRFAYEVIGGCTRKTVQAMLRNRRYGLHEARYRKDKGLVRVFMIDRWADPAMVQIGSYGKGDEPDWAAIYDEAMAAHEARKQNQNRYG